MSKYKALTKMVRFSYDYGKTWNFINFNDTDIFINNIIIEPDNSSSHFLVTGFEFDMINNKKKGVIFHLDFSEYHGDRICQGYDNPNSPTSDYEKFVPHVYKTQECNFF